MLMAFLYNINGFYYFDNHSRMGNSSRNPQDYDIVRNYRSQQWQLSSANYTPQLWKNRKTHQIAEIFRLYAIPSIQDMNRYEIRSTQQNFVKVFHIALSPNQALCFNQQYVRVLIEYIPIKLQNVSGLELEEALTILLSAFKGFNALSNNFVLIEPHQQLIGFNQWGKTKIWLNKQHNNNFPFQAFIANHLDKSRIQASHVRKIFDIIQRKTQFGQLPIPLKQIFRVNNPGYLQAIHIVQQFAYQNNLSLQRFIRTDIYVRKPNIYNSNFSNYERQINYLRGQSNQKVNIRPFNNSQEYPRPQLKRINSVDTLHTQKLINHSQSTVSFRIPYKYNISNLSGNNFGHHQARSSIPRIHFQRSNQSALPFLKQTALSTKNSSIQVKYLLTKQKIQHVKCISILSPLTQSPKIEEKSAIIASLEQQPITKRQQFTIFNLQQPDIQEISQKNHEVQQLKQKQYSEQQISCPKIQSNINILQNQPVFSQGEQTSRSRSIIDKVQSEMSQDLESQNPKYVSNAENIEQYQQHDQDIQVSGTFNYKVLYQRHNIQHVHQPLQQIGQQQNFSRQKEEDSKIKEAQEHQNLQPHHQVNDQVKHLDQKQNIPIDFESFAPVKLIQNQLVSFAPNHTSLPTEQSIQSEENIQTSKSFQYIQTERIHKKAENCQQLGFIHSNPPEHTAAQIQRKEINQAILSEDVRDMARLLQGKKRVSIDLINAESTQKPFYTNYTPVQSKFDVVVRRESTISQQSQRHQRPSAFAHLDTDEQIQNYVRNKYLGAQKDNFHSKVKVGRVQSQYQKHYVKEPETYDFTKKEQAKKLSQKEDNRGYLRSKTTANNKISYILQKPEQDFLDVNFLQRSLDKRYSANLKSAMKKRQEQDQLNIAKLDEGLMKFSTSKVTLTEKYNKQQKYYDSTQPKVDYKSEYYKWQNSTGFEYQSRPRQNIQLDNNKKKNKSVRIDNIPTQQFVYQLTSSDSSWKKYSKQTNKSPNNQVCVQNIYAKPNFCQDQKLNKASYQKSSLEQRYNKYVKNSNKNDVLPITPSINQIMSIKGDSRQMLSPIPEKRFEEDARLSYDQLRSFLWD